MPKLLPFPRYLSLPDGEVSALPVTRAGVHSLEPNPFIEKEGPTYCRIDIRGGETECRGLVGLLPAADFTRATVRPHESTLEARLERQRQLVTADRGALGKPILLTVPTMEDFWSAQPDPEPYLSFRGKFDTFEVSRVPPSPALPRGLPLRSRPLVIADGHHRAQAHAELFDFVPVVVVGADELTIKSFYRTIEVGTEQIATVTDRLGEHFKLEEQADDAPPVKPNEWVISLYDRHYRLHPIIPLAGRQSVRWFNRNILPKVFGVTNVRNDTRVGFSNVPVPPRPGVVVIQEFPLSRDRFFTEAMARTVLPPKSTRFGPRIPSGLVVWPG